MATHTLASFKPLAVQLVLSASIPPPSSGKLRPPGAPLESEQLRALLQHLADPAFTSEPAHHATIGSVLTALRLTATDIQPTTLAMAQHEFLARATPLALPPPGTDAYVDLVGTGGDGKETFNVSTTASVVAAGVDGMRVCKHGGRASSSSSGSSDLLTALGVPLMNVDAAKMSRVLASSPLAFLFAPHFHAAFAPLAPLRSSLGFPTLFNILGPLVNPARPARGVYGVHSSGLGAPYADALRLGGTKSAWVVCGQEGLDEISPAGPTDVWEVSEAGVTHRVVSPSDFGLPTHPLEAVRSGTAQQNAAVVFFLLTQAAQVPAEPLVEPVQTEAGAAAGLEPIPAGTDLRALFDYTLLQASALLHVAGRGELRACVELARDSLMSGRAQGALEALRTAMLRVAA